MDVCRKSFGGLSDVSVSSVLQCDECALGEFFDVAVPFVVAVVPFKLVVVPPNYYQDR